MLIMLLTCSAAKSPKLCYFDTICVMLRTSNVLYGENTGTEKGFRL